jgi:hypothetical protein
MGHANLNNLSTFFVRRLYALGQLSIHDCVQAMLKAGEELRASEGSYEDEGMLCMGMLDIIHYLTRIDPTTEGYSGPHGGGPWIEPALSAWQGRPRKSVTPLTARMLDELDRWSIQEPLNDSLTVNGAADRLEEEGHLAWAVLVRALPRQREVYTQWVRNKDDHWEWNEEGTEGWVFEHLPWRFCKGKRKNYRNEVPILGNVTH